MEAGLEENLRLVLETMTLDYDDIMQKAEVEAIHKMYEANTEEPSNWESLVRHNSL